MKESIWIDNPFLDSMEFVDFYKCVIKTFNIEISDNHLKIDELYDKRNDILAMVLFGNYNRKYITWFEYWVYFCG